MNGKAFRLTKLHKISFFSTVICGFLAYFYTMTHHFLTYDSMWNQYSDQDMISSGRQFLKYACRISSDYDLPWLNGVLSIFYLALAAMLITSVFQIKKEASAALVGGLMVTFPSIISTFCYTFTVDGYMLAILLITLAFYLTHRFRFGFFAGIVLTGISIGIYQAYFSYLILLCIIMLLLETAEGTDWRKLWQWAWRYLAVGVSGYLFYIVTLKLMLKIKGVELSGYQGSDKVLGGGMDFSALRFGLKAAWSSFVDFARYGNVLTTTLPMKIGFVVAALCAVVAYFYIFIIHGAYKKVWPVFLAGFLMILIPFGSNLITILSPGAYFHLLMRYSWVVLFLFCVLLAERLNEKKFLLVGRWIMQAALGIIIFEFMIVANIAAFQMNERYEKTYGLCLRIVDRLEQCDGYHSGDEVALIGGGVNEGYYPKTGITGQDLVGYFGAEGEYCINSTQKFSAFCSHYLNVTIHDVSEERAIALAETEEFKEMTNYPGSDSIRRIDGVWVICLNGGKEE